MTIERLLCRSIDCVYVQIKADVETQAEFVKSLAQEVRDAHYDKIEDVVAFVSWLDEELSFLVSTPAHPTAQDRHPVGLGILAAHPNRLPASYRSILISALYKAAVPAVPSLTCSCKDGAQDLPLTKIPTVPVRNARFGNFRLESRYRAP